MKWNLPGHLGHGSILAQTSVPERTHFGEFKFSFFSVGCSSVLVSTSDVIAIRSDGAATVACDGVGDHLTTEDTGCKFCKLKQLFRPSRNRPPPRRYFATFFRFSLFQRTLDNCFSVSNRLLRESLSNRSTTMCEKSSTLRCFLKLFE